MLTQYIMKLTREAVFAAAFISTMVLAPARIHAVSLLAVDFGTAENYVQSGFGELAGAVGQSTASASFGSYTVDLGTVLANPDQTSSRGFGSITATHAAAIAQSIRPLYRDYFYNDSDISGDGVSLAIGGVMPNTQYNLTLWSYDGDQSFSSTNTLWSPTNNSSGDSGSVTNFALPRPTTLNDYRTTIQISSTSSTLELLGTTTTGFGGTRLNGFRLNDGVSDVLSVDLGKPSPPPSPLQSGFNGMAGTFPMGANSPAPSTTSTFGSYTVTVSGDPYQGTDYTRVGFEDNAVGAAGIDPSIRALFEDALINNLDLNNGAGVNLSIQGVVPNAKYALRVWSYNADNTAYATPTQFGPRSGSNTTGTAASITQFATPLPTSLNDYSTTIVVSSTTTTLDIHAASTANFGGTRFNAFELSLLGDYNGDGKVNAADYVLWRKTDGTPAGYNAWRSNFGASVSAGSSSSVASAVPEPKAWVLVAAGLLTVYGQNRRRVRSSLAFA
jgi:hypothetical protein